MTVVVVAHGHSLYFVFFSRLLKAQLPFLLISHRIQLRLRVSSPTSGLSGKLPPPRFLFTSISLIFRTSRVSKTGNTPISAIFKGNYSEDEIHCLARTTIYLLCPPYLGKAAARSRTIHHRSSVLTKPLRNSHFIGLALLLLKPVIGPSLQTKSSQSVVC